MTHETDTLANHWWWRPGWQMGTRFYTFHLTFDDQHELHRLAADYRSALKPFPGLDLIPDQWLHLTMQGLGFADQVPDTDVDAVIEAARDTLDRVESFTLEFTRPVITPEAILWAVDPTGPAAVRDAVREAIGRVWPEVPEPATGFRAHVSIAYSNSEGPAAPIAAALETVHIEPAHVRIDAAQLIVLNRDNTMYEWTTRAAIPLGR